MGREEPRLWTPPLRPLTRETTRGFEVIEFADMIGAPLLPWQKWLVIHALELTPLGLPRFKKIIVLVARQNGKSSLKRTISLWRLYVDGARCVLGTAQDVALAREQMNLAKATIYSSPELYPEYAGDMNRTGEEYFWLRDESLPAKAPREAFPRYIIRATNRKAGRGLSIDEVNIDELREQQDWKGWSAISKTVNARAAAQIWAMSNAGDDNSAVLNQLRDAAGVRIGHDGVSYLGEARDESIGIFEWSAPDGCDLDDIHAIAQANPGLGHIIDISTIDSDRAVDPPNVYRTEVLCQRVENLDSAIDEANWRACADPTGKMPKTGLVAVFDVAPDKVVDGKRLPNTGHATLTAAALLSDGRVRLRVVKAWNNVEEARDELPGTLKELKPDVVGWYPSGPAGGFTPILRPPDLKPVKRGGVTRQMSGGTEYVELSGTQVAQACQGLEELARGRLVTHYNDPLLNAHVIGAQRLDTGDGWRFVRRGAGHCDAAYTAAGAAHIALTRPAMPKARIRSLSAA